MDVRRKHPDRVRVAYDVPGRGRQEAEVNVTGSFRPGQQVEVRYVAADPSRVRTSQQWRPTWRPARLLLVLVPALASMVWLVLAWVAGRQAARRT